MAFCRPVSVVAPIAVTELISIVSSLSMWATNLCWRELRFRAWPVHARRARRMTRRGRAILAAASGGRFALPFWRMAQSVARRCFRESGRQRELRARLFRAKDAPRRAGRPASALDGDWSCLREKRLLNGHHAKTVWPARNRAAHGPGICEARSEISGAPACVSRE